MKRLLKIAALINVLSVVFLGAHSEVPVAAAGADQYPEQFIIVIIPSYQNKEYFKKNLESVFSQKYSNYIVIYIDDASPDGTGDLVTKYVKELGQEDRFVLIQNAKRDRMLGNLYRAVQFCPDEAIIVQPDGDDYLSDNYVFQRINKIYSTEDVWITYGQFINYPTNELGYCKELDPEIVEKQWLRRKWWKPGQLRTFRAWLFKQIKLKDLIFTGPYWQGQFFPANGDLATYYPMMEMAGFKYKFIDEVIYIRILTEINDFKVNKEVQALGSQIIRHKPVYNRLTEPLLGYFDQFKESKADMVIISRNNPTHVEQLLQSIDQFVYQQGAITVVMQPSSDAMRDAYIDISKRYSIQLVDCGNTHKPATEMFENILTASAQQHVLFMLEGAVFNHFVDLHECIDKLERTFAQGFFLSLGSESSVSLATGQTQEVPPLFWLTDDINGWMLGFGEHDWRAHNNLFATVYRKKDVLAALANASGNTLHEILHSWAQQPGNNEDIGLCFDIPKVGYQKW